MSKAKKCDRCGKFYEKNVVMESKGSVLGSTIGGINTATKEGKTDEHFDLCDDCIKRLGEWIKKQNLDSRWIPVSVRYPDNAREVMVTIKRTENGKSRYMIDKAKCIHDIYTDRTVWDSYEYGAMGISNAKHMEVTAWIELPEPYKEDTQGE